MWTLGGFSYSSRSPTPIGATLGRLSGFLIRHDVGKGMCQMGYGEIWAENVGGM